MKETICTISGAIISVIAGFFGGWDASIATLLLFMAVDYISGLLVGATKKSLKTESGGLSSAIGFKGLAKKIGVLLLVLVSARLDIILGTAYIRHGVCVAFMVNELISIVENLGLLGIRLPSVLVDAIEVLQKKTETTEIKEDDE